jgi:hypothetical protein
MPWPSMRSSRGRDRASRPDIKAIHACCLVSLPLRCRATAAALLYNFFHLSRWASPALAAVRHLYVAPAHKRAFPPSRAPIVRSPYDRVRLCNKNFNSIDRFPTVPLY